MKVSAEIKVILMLMISALSILSLGAKFPESSINSQQSLSQNRGVHHYGGTLVWGVANKPMMMNPILTQTSVSAALMGLIFDSLVRIDSRGDIIPGVAKSWDVSDDGLVYTFHLRPGILFHDGTELTAEDVKFTYDLIKDPEINSVYSVHFKTVGHFEVVDRYTFRAVLKEPFTPFLYKMVRYIMPWHLWMDQDLKTSKLNDHPIGSGPFRFDSWDHSTDTITLKANPDYFQGRPYLDQVMVKTYEDNSQLLSALMRRDVDLVQWINSEDYALIHQDPGFKSYAVTGAMYYAVVYDLNDPIWSDKDLRLAIAHGLNISEIIEMSSMFGGDVSTGPFHPQSAGYNSDVKPLAYDPDLARAMLAQLGWKDDAPDADDSNDHIRRKNGQALELRLLVDERNETYKKIAVSIRQQLSEIGVKVVVIFYQDENVLTSDQIKDRHPQAWLRMFLGLSLDPYESSISWFSESHELSHTWDYHNFEVDRLFEEGRKNRDVRQRAKIYQKIHAMIYDDQPACFLFYPAGYFAINAEFQGTEEYFNRHMPIYTMKDWYMSPTQ